MGVYQAGYGEEFRSIGTRQGSGGEGGSSGADTGGCWFDLLGITPPALREMSMTQVSGYSEKLCSPSFRFLADIFPSSLAAHR